MLKPVPCKAELYKPLGRNFMKNAIVILSGILFSIQAFGGASGHQRIVDGFGDQTEGFGIERVQKQVTLIQSEQGDSNLRVSFVVSDNGGSTDLSPRATLYLTTLNKSEMKDAGSIHEISPLNELISTRRLAPGVYEAIVRSYALDFECSNWRKPYEGLLKIQVDARMLTADVRSFKGANDFEYKRVQTPVFVTTNCY